MGAYNQIVNKLESFYKKYYSNELIKGMIFFLSIGLFYFLLTIAVEYFFWLSPTLRTVLFFLFVFVEVFLFFKFILIPTFYLFRIRKGISHENASAIIGGFFPEVQDKLLNILQLKERSGNSELVLASIEQKAKEITPIPFKRAINFKANISYLKYTIAPLILWLLFVVTGNHLQFKKSIQRVVNYETAYTPPAPFSFQITNSNLKVIQGNPLEVEFEIIGNTVPNEAKIYFNNQEYYLQKRTVNRFVYQFSNVNSDFQFYVEANGVKSLDFDVEVIKTPSIQNILIHLDYPSYTKRKDEKIQNRNNLLVPAGTKATWQVYTQETDTLSFVEKQDKSHFIEITDNVFEHKKKLFSNTNYTISSSNKNLKDYEKLNFQINTIKDEYPEIKVQSVSDSLNLYTANFIGQVSDDYGIKKLELVYYNIDQPNTQYKYTLDSSSETVQSFMYSFPDGLEIKSGIDYELFFQVFDNDGVYGSKKTMSKKFNFRSKTEEEIDEELLENQKETINNLENTIIQQQKQQKNLEQLQNQIQNKKNLQWNDKKELQKFVERQQQYNQMMQRQTEQLQENIEEKKENTQSLQDQKEALKKRLEELKDLKRQQKLLDELQKMADKLNKEELIRKAKQLAQQNKQQERSLERILELTKRFYVEQKTMQLSNKLEELSKKQNKQSDQTDKNTEEKQDQINKEFDTISKELEDLQKDNEKLKESMEIPNLEEEKQSTKKQLNQSKESLKNNNKTQAKKNQKKAAKKMKEMSQQLQQAMMDMQANSIDENVDDLKKILKNLITFSFQQEDLMNKFDAINVQHPDFGKELKKQYEIKKYFEHIDDSLYVLSMRVPTISTEIQNDLSDAHYNLDQSLENFTENRFMNGVSNQQYVMTAANNLADFLSNMLDNMQNNMSMSGKGNKSGSSFSLPTLIKKQKGLSDAMKKGNQKGKGKEGEKGDNKNQKGKGSQGGEGEQQQGELFKIYQQQSQLRQELENAIKGMDGTKGSGARKALKTMEELENEILEKGFNPGTLQKMQQLEYQLLKLDKAAFQQGLDQKRKSETNNNTYQRRKVKQLELQKRFYNQIEILNRQSLPLQQIYKRKVKEYFSKD